MKNKKLKLPPITTRTEADLVMNVLATQVNNQRAIIAERDAAVLKISESYGPVLEEYTTGIKARTEILTAWIEANPGEFPKGKKTLELTNGTITQRTGTPALKVISKLWNWEKVLGAIKAKGFQFIRTTEEVDKDAILAFTRDAKDETAAAAIRETVLAPIGVKIDQDEKITIEPKLTEVESTLRS
jgi:phage host-nuclease inhibitor protein Gam